MSKLKQFTVIAVNGTITTFNKEDKLENLQEAIGGGNVQIVPGWNHFEGKRCTVYCDEEGKLKGQPVNEVASRMWATCYNANYDTFPDRLTGDILIVRPL